MLPSFDRETTFTRGEILAFTFALIITTMLPLMGHAGPLYQLGMAFSGIFLLYYAAKLARSSSKVLASRLVHASVIYLPVVLAIMMIAKA
jgi:heme O synthase-like polyprenyltransferase